MIKASNQSLLKWTGHILFWLVYAVLNYYLLENKLSSQFTFNRTILLVALQIPIVYLNIEVLIPKLFLRKHYLLFIASLIFTLILSNIILDFILQYFNVYFFHHERGFRRPLGPPGARSVFNYFLGLFLLMLSTVVELATINAKREKEAQQKRSENLDAELKFLRSQINPHFLFNTLNNLYSLAVTKSEKAPAVIMQLANMLRYNLYEANDKEKVSIEKEIAYIKDYIELYQLREEGIMKQVRFNYAVKHSAEIAPMLLIPFVENAFKHSQIEAGSDATISIELIVEEQKIKLEVINSIPQVPPEKDETGGIGIENVRKRIGLIYPEKSQLDISEDTLNFKVSLIIDLS